MSARRVCALVAAGAVIAAAPASADVAPGLVSFPVGAVARHDGVDPRGLTVGAALPGGEAVLAGISTRGDVALAALRADGSLDGSFGVAGVAHVRSASSAAVQLLQLLREPDARLLLVWSGTSSTPAGLPDMVVAGITPDGRLDPSFGDGGLARPPLQAACGNCSPASLQADGSVVVTGAVEQGPGDRRWAVARLTPAGALDTAFGQQGIATLPGTNGGGFATSVLPGDAIAALGSTDGAPRLARLTPTGALDPGFHGGVPVTPPGPGSSIWFGALGRPDGSIDVLAGARPRDLLVRYTPGGDLDPNFGDRGAAAFPGGGVIDELLPGPGGADVVAGPTTLALGPVTPRIRVTRVAADGTVAATRAVAIPFGGGYATVFAVHRAPAVIAPEQTGWSPGRALMRPNGSLLVPGALGVVQYTGEGAGYEVDRAAVAAIAPSLRLDPSFGGPARRATIRVRLPRQLATATTDVRRLSVAVTATASGPGLCLLTVRAGRRVVARSTAGVFAAGRQRLHALLTLSGRRALRHAHHVRVSVTARFRDLVGSTAAAKVRGVLR